MKFIAAAGQRRNGVYPDIAICSRRPRLAAPLNVRFPLERRRPLFVAIAIFAFVYANFRVFDDVSTKLDEANRRGGNSEALWPAADQLAFFWVGR
jgi:hypothetical protein